MVIPFPRFARRDSAASLFTLLAGIGLLSFADLATWLQSGGKEAVQDQAGAGGIERQEP